MKYIIIIAGFLFSQHTGAQDLLLDQLSAEMHRQKAAFEQLNPSPYYFSFKVEEITTQVIQSDFGGIIISDENLGRLANVSVRIGDYTADNTSVKNGGYQPGVSQMPIPIDDEANGVNFMMWLASDLQYKIAQATFNSLDADKKGLVFSKEDPVIYFEEKMPESAFRLDVDRWEQTLKELSSLANDQPNVTLSSTSLSRKLVRKYFLDSDGSSVVQNQNNCIVSLSINVVDDNGNQTPITKTFSAVDLSQLPSKDVLMEEMKTLVSTAIKLVDAPYVEPYSGPVLFSGEASAVFFHEVLGHRIEAERLTQITDGQTFINRLNTRILPKEFTVKSLPTIENFEGNVLTGSYHYDDQGVEAQNVTIVENGVLKNFLMSRKPLKYFISSNGHGRSSEGGMPTTRQSNLIVETQKGQSLERLRELLKKECKKQDKPFGYFIKEVSGGFTTTDRYQPNTINISPLEVYRVYVDGREDELVNGMNLVGTPLNVFSEIIASGDEPKVFNGYCGAESGYIPVSAVSSAILLKKMEIQRKPVFKSKLPILPPPTH